MAEIKISVDEEGLLKVYSRSKVDSEGYAIVSNTLTAWVCHTARNRPDLFELRGPDQETRKYRVKPTEAGETLLLYM